MNPLKSFLPHAFNVGQRQFASKLCSSEEHQGWCLLCLEKGWCWQRQRAGGERYILKNISSWKVVNIVLLFFLVSQSTCLGTPSPPHPSPLLSEVALLSSMDFFFHQSSLLLSYSGRTGFTIWMFPSCSPHPWRKYALSSLRCFLSFLVYLIEQALQLQMFIGTRKIIWVRKTGQGSQRTRVMPHERGGRYRASVDSYHGKWDLGIVRSVDFFTSPGNPGVLVKFFH